MTTTAQTVRQGGIPTIAALWASTDARVWDDALVRYWGFVRPENMVLEKALDALELSRLRSLDAHHWLAFLTDEYFRWKYTQPNRYGSTTAQLRTYVQRHGVERLDEIRGQLLRLDLGNIRNALDTACQIGGLGPAGASGLLSLMYPGHFGTVDQFVVKALRGVPGLPETAALWKMKPENLSIPQSVVLMGILRRKAAENNRVLGSNAWTPRKIDMVLWTYGRDPDCR